KITADLNEIAIKQIDNIEEAKVLIAASDHFEAGVIGLVAGRLKEAFYRPSIVIEIGEEESHGSCRSIPELNITHVLDEVSDILVRYGGHAAAAGLTIENDQIPNFQTRITDIINTKLADQTLVPTLEIDAELDIESVDWALYDHLQQLEPTGAANPTPIFMSQGVEVTFHRTVGRDGSHLQLELQKNAVDTVQCIAFGQGSIWGHQMPRFIDLVYSIGRNDWKGNRRLQLMVHDIRPAKSQ
ncbi:MAG: DHHA1 domain-containing protein, partial [Chloroflexota bacterium]